MALKADGTVYAWGSNLYGALGNATTNNTKPIAVNRGQRFFSMLSSFLPLRRM
jgi:alpha-tubulin suppressor-like RCC1 family protein